MKEPEYWPEKTNDLPIGKATYTNKVTGEKQELAFQLVGDDTELGKAWDLVSTVARKNGWNAADIAVKVGAK